MLVHLVLVVLVLLYLICFYCTLVLLCCILVYYLFLSSASLLLLLSLCTYIKSIYTVIVEISSPILKPFSLIAIKCSLLIDIFLGTSSLSLEILDDPPCYIRQCSLSLIYHSIVWGLMSCTVCTTIHNCLSLGSFSLQILGGI